MKNDVSPATMLLRMAHDPRFRTFVETRSVNSHVVSKFVAGETATDALNATGELLARGRYVTISHLAPDPLDTTQARTHRKRLRKALRRTVQAGYNVEERIEIAIRPGALGARLPNNGHELALEHARRITHTATEMGARVLIESEPGLPASDTLSFTDALRRDYPDTGVELWSMRKRTEQDILERIDSQCRVRLSYGTDEARGGEDETHGARDTDLAYVRSLTELMRSSATFSVSAADRRVVEISEALVAAGERQAGTFEYHLRMGTHPIAEATIADRGDRMRVLVPFGRDWYPYLMGRVADQPGQFLALFRPTKAARRAKARGKR
ncbi:Proline dehydrogenase 1 [Dermatophilus congolensis]|uniref:Proline dehydrogenase 1 n=1 Tax=Dermatophilus congolensis TaxID=1863 RepID=A0A239VAT6_9MICO|nr:hypothetical protein [Dermatophilus congolensis]SNV19275.1 Proline dehydrogenase 1 [Dermatophilus congolensis]